MNITPLFKVTRYRQISLLFYILFLTCESMAVALSPLSEAEIEKHLMTLDTKSSVASVAFSLDDRFITYGSDDNHVRLWNIHSGELLKRFEGHTQPITSVAFSPDSKKLASSSEDKTIRLWDIDSKSLIRIFEGYNNTVNSIAFHPDGNILASSSNGGKIHLWQVHSAELIKKPFKWTSKYMRAIAFSPDGKILAAGASDLKIRLWNVKNLKMYKPRLQCTKYQQVTSLDFSPDSKMLASGFSDGKVCIWNIQTKKLITQFYEHKPAAFISVTFRADGRMLAYSLYESIYLWETRNEKSRQLLTVPDGHYVRAVKFNPHFNRQNILAYASSDGTVRLWDTHNNHLLSVFADNAKKQSLSCVGQRCLCSGIPCVLDIAEKQSEEPGEVKTVNQSSSISYIQDDVTEVAMSDDKPLSVLPTQALPPTELLPWCQLFCILALVLIILVLLVSLVFFFRRLICRKNANLLETALPQLPQKHQLLRRTYCLKEVLVKNQVSEKCLNDAIAFVQKMSPLEQTELLATRLGGKQWEPVEADLFTVILQEHFPLNLSFFSLYFLPPEQTLVEVLHKLHQRQDLAIQKIVVITFNSEQQCFLRSHIKEMRLSWVVPNQIELTSWLLSPDPVQTVARIFAMQLNVTQISPYQTRSGVNKDAVFFGRTEILAHIFNRAPANYLIVGGRQLGKSSLLKYIDRRYQNHPQVRCYYLTLHSDDLKGQLAMILGLPADSNLETVFTFLVDILPKRQQLLLIDQADHFIQAEMKNGYQTLNYLRCLSEDGYCHFILAGFWDLYQASVLDYQSPLKNFGEPITIAELEEKACYDLAVKPMQMMNLRYESETLVKDLIRETGQRASLIATVCNELLKNLASDQRVFTGEVLTKALNSETVKEALRGWQATSSVGDAMADEQASRLDRIIVYATVKAGEIKSAPLRELLDTLGCTYSAEQVKQSLERLVLSFVIKREPQGRFVYYVPLFRRWLLEDEDVDDLLQWELKEI